MIRDDKLRFLALAMAAMLGAGCDNATEPGLPDFDADAISAGVDGVFAPIDASNDPNFALTHFVSTMLGDQAAAFRQQDLMERVRDTRFRTLARQVGLDAEVDIPPQMYGQTFVYNPVDDVWEPDEGRTGAPENGLRLIWYRTDDTGIMQSLEELGYIDLTDEGTASLDRLGVLIIRTAGGTLTLADFIHGHGITETETSWTEVLEFAGTFSNGTATVAVDISLDASGNWDGDEVYVWDIFLTGAETSYRWGLDGELVASGDYDENLVVSITHDAALTVLDLQLTGNDVDGTGTGTGTLSHAGNTIANVTSGNQNFTFSKPEGGSFTAQEENKLSLLMTTMVLYGPLMLISMPLIVAAF